MCVTRTFSVLLTAGFCGLLAVPELAGAQESDAFSKQFYSFMPAKPKLDAPSIGDASLWQGHMQKAKRAYRDGEYGRARKHLEAALENGNNLAAWYLGHIWRLGLGVDADQGKAFDYYERVAAEYDAAEPRPGVLDIVVDSVVRVADYRREGDSASGIKADPPTAFRLYNAAASHGHPGAQFGLASMYLKGTWLNKNTDQALRWLTLAARKNYPPAQALLGDLYWSGDILPEDRARAIMWYTLATKSAQPEMYPQIFDRHSVMLAEATEAQRLDGEARAHDWSERFPSSPPVTLSSEVQ